MLTISPIPAFDDNYIWLLQFDCGFIAVVDPGDAGPVIEHLDARDLSPGAILITHHHWDHTNGIEALLARWPVPVYGPASDRIPQITTALNEGDKLELAGVEFSVFAVPGHTLDHIAYYGEPRDQEPVLLCGDTLFAAGCGRLLEGSAQQMYTSLNRLAQLPARTQVFCAHEYTLANLAFAKAVEPGNTQLLERIERDQLRRSRGQPTLPTSIALEQQTNPFLRCNHPAVVASANQRAQQPVTDASQTFALLRSWKDHFVI